MTWNPEPRAEAKEPTKPTPELKRAFAEALLRFPDDPAKAAFAISNDNGFALQIAVLWPKDGEVIAYQKELLDERGEKSFLVSKEQQARDVYCIANNVKVDDEVRLKAHRLYAEIMGHIAKETQSGTANILNQGVMIVKVNGSDDDWQAKTIQQQRELTAHA